MTKYWISIHRPNGYEPAISEDGTMTREIDALNEEMIAAGIRVFVGGLQSPSSAMSIRHEKDDAIISDGPYLQTSEHVGGFWVLEVASLDDALHWGRKASAACKAPVEVRPFH